MCGAFFNSVTESVNRLINPLSLKAVSGVLLVGRLAHRDLGVTPCCICWWRSLKPFEIILSKIIHNNIITR